jgi:hypothetical protein
MMSLLYKIAVVLDNASESKQMETWAPTVQR